MSRPFLSPKDRDRIAGTWVTTESCPKEIINFGLVPNYKKLMPGDLLLFQSTDNVAPADKFSGEIIAEQHRQNFPEESRVWTHAAVYVSDFNIVEADFASPWSNGVRYVPMWDYVGKHNIRVRRPKLPIDGIEKADGELRWQIAIEAMSQLPHGYSARNALWLKWKNRKLMRMLLKPVAAGRICTQVYAKAYTEATTKPVIPFFQVQDMAQYSQNLFLPAHLDRTDKLEDQDVDWLRIVPPKA